MNPVKKILNKLDGLYYPQEYLCLAKESFQPTLYVFLIANGKVIKDITNSHLFTGYHPLIITLFATTGNDQVFADTIEIILSPASLQLNETLRKKDALAKLSLQLIRKQATGDTLLFYYEGIKGQHRFISLFHQSILGLYNRLYNKKPGNVFLDGNLYKQVQIAYAIPRIISLITMGDGELYNLFPTDLHGPVNEQYYVDSLRQEGKACKQVEASGKVVITQMLAPSYQLVYSLGKNHMQEPKPAEYFPFGGEHSPVFQLPVPQRALIYRELELIESFTHGIHKLLLFKVVSFTSTTRPPVTLAHIHNVYATWRHNKGLAGNYLLR